MNKQDEYLLNYLYWMNDGRLNEVAQRFRSLLRELENKDRQLDAVMEMLNERIDVNS